MGIAESLPRLFVELAKAEKRNGGHFLAPTDLPAALRAIGEDEGRWGDLDRSFLEIGYFKEAGSTGKRTLTAAAHARANRTS